MMFSYVIAAIAVCVVIVVLMVLSGGKKKVAADASAPDAPGGGKKKPTKSQSQIVKEANRRLAKNPDDPNGLVPLGDVCFTNQVWDKALSIYQNLIRISSTVVSDKINIGEVKTRAGICSFKLEKYDDAIKYLTEAYALAPHSFDVNYYLGAAFCKGKQYDKATSCLKKAMMIDPQAENINVLLGESLYKTNHFKESQPYFKKALDADPGNKEALFDLADAMSEEGHGDKAIKVFMHLRPDPVYGARSCLRAGIYHFNQGTKDVAVQDFLIGLKHTSAAPETLTELKYRLALCYFDLNKFPQGLDLLRQIRATDENYKDVNALIARYQELSQNTNLQVYLSGTVGDFTALCRKIVSSFYKNANVTIQDIRVGSAYTDIVANVSSPRFDNTEVFRFFRTTGTTGEFYVREFHDSLHDAKLDKGFCVTAGAFSSEAHKYIEGRPVDLIEKVQLSKLLKAIAV
ncbi:MAG: tetratricopeptide repeat protein [Treponema sp.]|nr:tetratricopeptide repeat protein [Treponema sp.]